MPGSLPLIIILVMAFIIVKAILSRKDTQARSDQLAAFAAQQGWEFDPMKNRNIRHQFEGIELFGRGEDRYGENAICGACEGRKFLIFDYHYEDGNESPEHHYCTVVALRSPFLLKPLSIRPMEFWDKVTAAFGGAGIDFDSAEFSRRYRVSGPDRRWAHDVITPRTMEMLLEWDKVALTMTNTHILLTRSVRLGPKGMLYALAICTGMLDGIPQQARESFPAI